MNNWTCITHQRIIFTKFPTKLPALDRAMEVNKIILKIYVKLEISRSQCGHSSGLGVWFSGCVLHLHNRAARQRRLWIPPSPKFHYPSWAGNMGWHNGSHQIYVAWQTVTNTVYVNLEINTKLLATASEDYTINSSL